MEGSQVGLDNTPHHSLGDGCVSVNQTIAESDDPFRVADLVSQTRVYSQSLAQRLADDLELPFHRGPQQCVARVV